MGTTRKSEADLKTEAIIDKEFIIGEMGDEMQAFVLYNS